MYLHKYLASEKSPPMTSPHTTIEDKESQITPAVPPTSASPQEMQQGQSQQAVRLDDSKVATCYANFCRVTGTPEELIIDFGLNSQPMGVLADPIVITQRLVTNFFTAKHLLQALHLTLQRHEAAFGVLETNVQKRVQNPRT